MYLCHAKEIHELSESNDYIPVAVIPSVSSFGSFVPPPATRQQQEMRNAIIVLNLCWFQNWACSDEIRTIKSLLSN